MPKQDKQVKALVDVRKIVGAKTCYNAPFPLGFMNPESKKIKACPIPILRNITSHLQERHYRVKLNQRVENTDAAFVKGANERNEFFEKINKQNI